QATAGVPKKTVSLEGFTPFRCAQFCAHPGAKLRPERAHRRVTAGNWPRVRESASHYGPALYRKDRRDAPLKQGVGANHHAIDKRHRPAPPGVIAAVPRA